MHTHTHTHIHTYAHTHINAVYTCTYTQTHTHTNKHTRTQNGVGSSEELASKVYIYVCVYLYVGICMPVSPSLSPPLSLVRASYVSFFPPSLTLCLPPSPHTSSLLRSPLSLLHLCGVCMQGRLQSTLSQNVLTETTHNHSRSQTKSSCRRVEIAISEKLMQHIAIATHHNNPSGSKH